MTVHAAPRWTAREVTQRARVAVVAREVLVGAGQVEIRLGVMVEFPPWPAIGVVAAAAILTQVSTVIVIGGVTVDALVRGVPVGACEMTLTAGDTAVKTQQRKAREIVVEAYVAEERLPMAALAALSEVTGVNVVGPVTVGAIHRHRGRESIGVTDDALHVLVRTVQREVGVACVIEVDATPAALVVTLLAIVAELTAMVVVVRVAADAACGCR